MKKYEYLTGEDLGYESSVIEQAKSDDSPFGKVFIKGLNEDDQKEGLLKRLKNTEDKNEEQLMVIKGRTDTKSQIIFLRRLIFQSHCFA